MYFCIASRIIQPVTFTAQIFNFRKNFLIFSSMFLIEDFQTVDISDSQGVRRLSNDHHSSEESSMMGA